MAIVKTMKCDGCGKEEPYGALDGTWYRLDAMSSPKHLRELMEKLGPMEDLVDENTGGLKDGVLDNIADTGDFHSLECLVNWASARANLRALDAELDV